jgi:hypothetical protein
MRFQGDFSTRQSLLTAAELGVTLGPAPARRGESQGLRARPDGEAKPAGPPAEEGQPGVGAAQGHAAIPAGKSAGVSVGRVSRARAAGTATTATGRRRADRLWRGGSRTCAAALKTAGPPTVLVGVFKFNRVYSVAQWGVCEQGGHGVRDYRVAKWGRAAHWAIGSRGRPVGPRGRRGQARPERRAAQKPESTQVSQPGPSTARARMACVW